MYCFCVLGLGISVLEECNVGNLLYFVDDYMDFEFDAFCWKMCWTMLEESGLYCSCLFFIICSCFLMHSSTDDFEEYVTQISDIFIVSYDTPYLHSIFQTCHSSSSPSSPSSLSSPSSHFINSL